MWQLLLSRRNSSALYNVPLFTASLESAYQLLWESYAYGTYPSHLMLAQHNVAPAISSFTHRTLEESLGRVGS